ncbi:PREDICTED: exopolygalacturonase-like [Nicotiana attenuata]|uniref:exopolygalacturonase-like n=1 Tax=Nicotiana attenuata TaxID=49451 RepID=UPI00090556F3|nr:PREDICTED: exopolygalacturonase-like [Nicotiana attenuata]
MALISSFGIAFLLCLILGCSSAEEKLFNVQSYGAIADGKTDNSKALLSTWKDACQWNGTAKFLIPSGEYMVYAANFIGPCSGSMIFQIQGVVKAATDPSLFCNSTWISFQYVNGLEIEGGGTLDGQGASAWPYFDTSKNSNCPTLPIFRRKSAFTILLNHRSIANQKIVTLQNFFHHLRGYKILLFVVIM